MDLEGMARRLTFNAFAQADASDDYLAQIQRDLEAIKAGTYTPTKDAQQMLDILNAINERLEAIMAFKAFEGGKSSADPTLVELDGGVATLSDGTTLTFPPGVKFEHEEAPGKEAQRISTDKVTFVLIRGASKRTVEAAIRRCVEGR